MEEEIKRGPKAELKPKIAALLKEYPLLSLTDVAEVLDASGQYVMTVLDSTPGLRAERKAAKAKLIAKLKKRPLGYINSHVED